MAVELIIFSAILVVSVILHLFFWFDSKKRYAECIKRADALRKRMEHLEESNEEMDKMLDEAELAIDRIDEGIEELRSGRFLRGEKRTFEN